MSSINPDRMYKLFSSVLDDDDVKSLIMNKLADKQADGMLDGQTGLFPINDGADDAELFRRNRELSERISELMRDNSALRRSLAQSEKRYMQCADTTDMYEREFAVQIRIHRLFMSLSEKTRRSLGGVFKNSSLNGLLMCGVQFDNLSSLRNLTEQLLVNSYPEIHEDIPALADIYKQLLECYNSTFSEPVYMLTDFSGNDTFDSERHFSLNGRNHGTVSRIILQGVICVRNGKIIRRAFTAVN